MKKMVMFVVIFAFMAGSAQFASAQISERIRFARGTHGVAKRGTVRGYAYHDYRIGASAGQTMTLTLISTESPSVFSVFYKKGELDGATESNDFTGTLPMTGDYTIRVLLMRSEARRKGSLSDYTLKISVK